MRAANRICLAFAMLLAGYLPASASQATSQVSNSATVVPNCKITADNMSFTYNPTAAAATASATVRVTCTKGSSNVTVGLGSGLNPNKGSCSSGSCTRAMLNGASNYLGYDIFTTSGYTTVWNNTNTVAVTNASSGSEQQLTAFGKVPAGQLVAAGTYIDSVTATVNY